MSALQPSFPAVTGWRSSIWKMNHNIRYNLPLVMLASICFTVSSPFLGAAPPEFWLASYPGKTKKRKIWAISDSLCDCSWSPVWKWFSFPPSSTSHSRLPHAWLEAMSIWAYLGATKTLNFWGIWAFVQCHSQVVFIVLIILPYLLKLKKNFLIGR